MPALPVLPSPSAARPRWARRLGRSTAVTAALTVLVGAVLGGAGTALAAPPVPPGLPKGIEPLASYVGQKTCDATAKPGMTSLRTLALTTYRGTGDLGIVRDCAIGGTSEHKEGRAWDWAVDSTDPAQDAAARDMFTWLLAPDAYGNKAAMARRLGIMYMIYNRSIWSSYNADAGWRPYSGSNPHAEHVHISLAWPGARKATSYWTGVPAPASSFSSSSPAPTGTTGSTPKPPATSPTPSAGSDPIGALWRTLGGSGGVLGAPVGSPYAVRGGRAQDYQRGRIYHAEATGTHAVTGAVAARYAAAGGPAGPLGLPLAEAASAGSGTAQRFSGGRIYASGSAARVVWGAIAAAYVASGGASGPLGLPVAEEAASGAGVVQRFERGTVHWSAGTGAQVLTGAVAARHLAQGGAAGPLGLPTSGELSVAGGTATSFVGGRIYRSPAGTVALWGDIAKKHLALGGAGGTLGLPTAEEAPVRGGVSVPFARGRVYWSAATGARAVWGGILERYLATGGAAGPLGLPTSDEVDVPGGRQTLFQGGRVLWSAGTGAQAVYGGIAQAYAAAGGADGPLGLPTTGESDAPGGRVSGFQRGRIYWSPATGARPVWGDILQRYLALGGPAAAGFPVAGEQAVADGSYSRFQRGSIYWSPRTGARWVAGGIGERYATADPAVVGFPTGEEVAAGAGRVLGLQRGAVYWSAATGARLVGPAEEAHHTRLGGVRGFLGLPVGERVQVAPGVQRQAFQGGQVLTTERGTVSVRGAILARWLELGGPTGRLGAPVSDEYDVAGGSRSDFVGGALTWSAATGQVTLS